MNDFILLINPKMSDDFQQKIFSVTFEPSVRVLLQISYHGSGEGGESDDSEGENQELAQIDRGQCPLRSCLMKTISLLY